MGYNGRIGIRDATFKLPESYVRVDELLEQNMEYIRHIRDDVLQVPKLKTVDLKEIDRVHAFKDEPRGNLALEAINDILEKRNISGKDASLLVDFSTTSRDINGLSLCYRIQSKIGAEDALTLAIGNGSCSLLHLALKVALSIMNDDENAKFAILFAEDRVTGRRINIPSNVLGDGASAVLLERDCETGIVMDIAFTSMGRYCDVLGINHWEKDNFDVGEFEQYIIPMHYRVILDLTKKVLKRNNIGMQDIGLVLYQNMCLNDYYGMIGTMGISPGRVFMDGLKGKGHIFGSDLVINYCMARDKGLSQKGQNILLISSGAGFSWGVTLVRA